MTRRVHPVSGNARRFLKQRRTFPRYLERSCSRRVVVQGGARINGTGVASATTTAHRYLCCHSSARIGTTSAGTKVYHQRGQFQTPRSPPGERRFWIANTDNAAKVTAIFVLRTRPGPSWASRLRGLIPIVTGVLFWTRGSSGNFRLDPPRGGSSLWWSSPRKWRRHIASQLCGGVGDPFTREAIFAI